MGAERLIPLALVALLAAGCQGSESADTTPTTGRAAAVVEWVNDGDTLLCMVPESGRFSVAFMHLTAVRTGADRG